MPKQKTETSFSALQRRSMTAEHVPFCSQSLPGKQRLRTAEKIEDGAGAASSKGMRLFHIENDVPQPHVF
jgi:hypothetical protein